MTADTRRAGDAAPNTSGAAAGAARPAPPLLVVVVNYRTPDLTIQCLSSLAGEVPAVPGMRAVVVDNASGDDSVERMRRAIADNRWSSWAEVVPASRNGGFAWGNNRGLESGGPARNVLLLNSDAIVHPGCLAHCLRLMDADPTIGVLSCKLLNADGTLQVAARRFPNPLRLVLGATGLPWRLPRALGWAQGEYRSWDQSTEAGDGDWLGGAFMLVRGDLISRLGGLDESFFFYGEDIEFCHRVRRAGLRCRYDPGAAATHLGGGSSDPSRIDATLRSVHRWRGRYLVQRRCYGRLAEAVVRAADVAGCAARVAWMRVRGRGGERAYEDLRATLRLLARPLGGNA